MAEKIIIERPASGELADSLQTYNQVVGLSKSEGWGWLPGLSFLSALGLLLISVAYTAARNEASRAELLFWIGLIVLFTPIASRLISPVPSRQERVGLVALLGLGLYLVKVMHTPLSFGFTDELLHWRTAMDVIQTGHLFQENPLLPVSSFYPGLENATSALVNLSKLEIFDAGIVLIGVARLVFILVLYLFYEEISGSAHVAGIASMLYMTNPFFLFVDASFSYETLGLPFALLVLFAAVRRLRLINSNRVGLGIVILVGLAAVVTTHHITSYMLVTFLFLWAATDLVMGRKNNAHPNPIWLALLALVICLTWMLYIAIITVGYLAPQLKAIFGDLAQLIAGEAIHRQLFQNPQGQYAPIWEQIIGYTAVALSLFGLPFGLYQIRRWYQANIVVLTLALATLAYPLSLAARLTRFHAIVTRMSEFVFVAVAPVLAIGFVGFWLSRWPSRATATTLTISATIMFLGGIIVGWSPWARLPGPYLVASESRSIELQSVTAAEWARVMLGPGNRIATDRVNQLLMATFGEQRPVTMHNDNVPVPLVFFSPNLGAAELAILQYGKIQYLVVDMRLSSGLPMSGTYFWLDEPGALEHKTPIDPTALAKFDGLINVNRIFDSGDIVIYDIGALSRVP